MATNHFLYFHEEMRAIFLFYILLVSCTVSRKNDSSTNTDSNSIVFVTLSIHKDSTNSKHIIELLSKTQSSGKIKNQNSFHSENYLSIYIYNNNKLVDTMTIEHPLYKHLEYLNAKNTFSVKDTVLDRAEFFIRVQTHGNSNEIRIFETIKNKTKNELTTIKL